MSTDHEPLRDESQAQRRPPTSSREGALLVLLGVLCAGGGLALTILPRFSWKASQIMVGLDHLGVHGGTLVVGGLLLMSVGLVRRALDATRPDPDEEHDRELLLEQVATDLMELRGTLDELREESAKSAGELGALKTAVTQLGERSDSQAGQLSQDALFQLAASLDKLGARLDQRIKVGQSSLQESIDELAATVEHSRRNLEERLTAPEVAAVADSGLAMDAPAACVDEGQAAQAGPERSLGVLDSLDDEHMPAPLPLRTGRPTVAVDGVEFDALTAASELEQAARANRNGSWDEQFMVEQGADDTAQKLEQLQSLLSDERLRSALENMRRQA